MMKTTGANSAPVVLLGATTPGAPGWGPRRTLFVGVTRPSGTWVFALRANLCRHIVQNGADLSFEARKADRGDGKITQHQRVPLLSIEAGVVCRRTRYALRDQLPYGRWIGGR